MELESLLLLLRLLRKYHRHICSNSMHCKKNISQLQFLIILGKDIKTGLPPILDYGVPGRGIEDQAKFVMELPFNQYMDSFPDEKDGLWGVVREVLCADVNIPSLREKYKDTKRFLIRHE